MSIGDVTSTHFVLQMFFVFPLTIKTNLSPIYF